MRCGHVQVWLRFCGVHKLPAEHSVFGRGDQLRLRGGLHGGSWWWRDLHSMRCWHVEGCHGLCGVRRVPGWHILALHGFCGVHELHASCSVCGRKYNAQQLRMCGGLHGDCW